MAPHSSTLAWKIPWMEEPGRLQSMGLSLRRGVRASGPSQGRTGESGAFGMWPHTRGSPGGAWNATPRSLPSLERKITQEEGRQYGRQGVVPPRVNRQSEQQAGPGPKHSAEKEM